MRSSCSCRFTPQIVTGCPLMQNRPAGKTQLFSVSCCLSRICLGQGRWSFSSEIASKSHPKRRLVYYIMFELVISTKQKCNNGIQCAAQFCFWQGKGCYGPMGLQKASKKAIKKDARIHSKQSPKKSTTDQPMLTYNKLACLWQVHGLDVP